MGVNFMFSSSSLGNNDDKTIKMFSSSSLETPRIQVLEVKKLVFGNPDPSNYKILKSYTYNDFLILFVKYPDSKNYEGNKILVFENTTIEELEIQGKIDPHFAESKFGHSPIARFEPTDKGLEYAISFITNIKK